MGVITRINRYGGGVTASLSVKQVEHYENLSSVLVEIEGKLIPFFVESIQLRSNGKGTIRFENVSSEKEAQLLLRCGLYLPLEHLPQVEQRQAAAHSGIEGFKVVDAQKGGVGVIKSIIDIPANPIIQVDADGKELLLPKQASFIQRVDRVNQILYIDAPVGLIDLYLSL